jgi:hypothetical protein
MLNFKNTLAALALGALALGGCTSARVLNIQDAPIGASAQGQDAGPAIELALTRRGWQVTDRRPGAVDAAIDVRQHHAEITVSYDADSFSIDYRDSRGLEYRNGSIHRNYNRWISRLDNNIRTSLGSPAIDH